MSDSINGIELHVSSFGPGSDGGIEEDWASSEVGSPKPNSARPFDTKSEKKQDDDNVADAIHPISRLSAYFFWLEKLHESIVVDHRRKSKERQERMQRRGEGRGFGQFEAFDVAAPPAPVVPQGMCAQQ